MKIIKKYRLLPLALFFFLFIPINPLYFKSNTSMLPNLSQPTILKMGVSAQIIFGNWDPAITDGYNILEYYKKSCLEPLFWYPDDSIIPEPQLAISWDYEYRPEGFINALGFNNSGGLEAINITLRSGVTFSDGSNWNATVAKWNIDRLFLITGNLTDNANGVFDQRNAGAYWIDVNSVSPYFTANWNLSEYDAPDATVTPVFSPPDPTRYSYYYLSDPDGPSPIIANNSDPYGGFDPVSNSFIHYAPYDKFPVVKCVEIIEDLSSGGKIRVELNSWNLLGIEDSLWTPQISMKTYKDYYETGINGYENGNDMIGTGPYIFQDHDEITDYGYMIKNENYWNKSALEANGWFNADQVDFLQFPPGDLGRDAQNIALLTHSIDYVFDAIPMNIDYDTVISDPNINYIEYGVSDYITQITLNSINETWWSGKPSPQFDFVDIHAWYSNTIGADPAANGIPRPLRKALNYAFDYDALIHTSLDDRVVRAGGMLGVDNFYYNSTVPVPFYNLTYAREVLLSTESDSYSLTDPAWPELADNHNFSKQLANRGLTDPTDNSSNNALWQSVANSNPIVTINFYWDDVHQDLKDIFELACNNLGVAIVQDADNKAPGGMTLWDLAIGSYWISTLDGVHSIWSAQAWVMDYTMPDAKPLGWVEANYADPNKGSWRAPIYTVTDFFPWWNFGFSYDPVIDYWLGRAMYSDAVERNYWFSKIAEKEHNELYPMIYVYQGKEGRVLWNDWEMNFNRGDLFFANFRYKTPQIEPFPPSAFILTTDADFPNDDGFFNLSWTSSDRADNYSLYMHNSPITSIEPTISLIINQTATSPYLVSELSNGEYYFVVVAHNQYGDTLSNNVHVNVRPIGEIPGYNAFIILGIAVCAFLIFLRRKRMKFG
ncbi:MAG: ABC transporter substrate-binding protein [Promethearchaeota archaeon]